MEMIQKTTTEFREAEMKTKLKDCQNIRVRSYQHQGNYVEEDKIWHGLASLINQKSNIVFLHCNGQVVKVAACKAKPYELRKRELEKNEEQKKEGEGNDWNKWIDEDENKENENEDENKEKEKEDEN